MPLAFHSSFISKDAKSIYRVVSGEKKGKGLPSGHCNGAVSCQHPTREFLRFISVI